MTADMELDFDKYMAMYDQYLDEPYGPARDSLKQAMQEIESKYGIEGEWF